MRTFVYEALPSRVLFGSGAIKELATEVARLDLKRILVLSTPQQSAYAQRVVDRIKDRSVGAFSLAAMHTPTDVTEAALKIVVGKQVDGVVAVGGGSAIGLGKAIAYRTDLPQVVLPTTYAGSEMTPIMGETQDGAKTTKRSSKILPEVVIYDVDLTLTLPRELSVTSGMNALAHAAEALYAQERNPLTILMAEEAIRILANALPHIVRNPIEMGARSDALYGAWLCGICLATAGMALHHKLCHTLGGLFNLPHAETHTIILPHAIAYNAPFAEDAASRIARALGGDDAGAALFDLTGRLGAKRALREIGMPESGIDRAADAAAKNPYWNPRAIDRDCIRELIARAWSGDSPRS
jgi:maleylacetate reductase